MVEAGPTAVSYEDLVKKCSPRAWGWAALGLMGGTSRKCSPPNQIFFYGEGAVVQPRADDTYELTGWVLRSGGGARMIGPAALGELTRPGADVMEGGKDRQTEPEVLVECHAWRAFEKRGDHHEGDRFAEREAVIPATRAETCSASARTFAP